MSNELLSQPWIKAPSIEGVNAFVSRPLPPPSAATATYSGPLADSDIQAWLDTIVMDEVVPTAVVQFDLRNPERADHLLQPKWATRVNRLCREKIPHLQIVHFAVGGDVVENAVRAAVWAGVARWAILTTWANRG